MVNWSSKKLGDWLLLLNGLVIIVLINQLATQYFFRIDLTEENRFSIKPQTIELLQNIEDEVFVEVFLDGDLNPGFTRIRNSIKEILEEFRVYSRNRFHYTFINPQAASSEKAQKEYMESLIRKGISPFPVSYKRNGKVEQMTVFPGATVSNGVSENTVMFLKGGRGEKIQHVIEDVEFELANAIQKLDFTNQRKIGWVVGHGELDSLHTASLVNALLEQYQVFKINLADKKEVTEYDLLLVAKPIKQFSPADLYKLDQYIVKGGRVIFLIDRLDASMEKASEENYFAFPTDVNLDDLFFKYGIRINLDLIQDVSSLKYPIVTGVTNGRPQITPLDWPFFPMVNHYSNHPATRNLDASIFKFASSIDTVKADGIKKTPLIFTSQYSRVLGAPVLVTAASLRNLKPESFQAGPKPLAYLMEGSFTSMFKNRFKPDGVDEKLFKESGAGAKVVVISDGDFVRNEINSQTGQPSPLGFDPVFNVTFANQDFMLNVISYLVNEGGIINARSKEIRIRPLNKAKAADEKTYWQTLNLVVPVLLMIMLGAMLTYWRKRKYSVSVIKQKTES